MLLTFRKAGLRLGPKFTERLAAALANAESGEALKRLAEEQAALRRMATLVARGAPPHDLFTAVVEEVGRLLPVASAAMGRCDADGMITTVAAWSSSEIAFPAGVRWSPEGRSVTAIVVQTGRPARLEDFSDASGPIGDHGREAGYRWAVGCPITVEDRLWGVMTAASTSEEPLPAGIEDRLASFTELVATSIANAESREALARVADEQAALRRVATLVAQGVQPAEIFSAVSEEVAGLFKTDAAGVARFEHGDQAMVFVGAAKGLSRWVPVGTRWDFDDAMATAQVRRTGSSARMNAEKLFAAGGSAAVAASRLGLVSSVASPIVVEGRLWGAISVAAGEELPADAEERLENFSDLVATAIANAESRSELAASRRRIVTAADDTRRRIERDLHDGTQQRLVSLELGLRAAEADLPPDKAELRAELARVASGLSDAVEELREISRGIHPAILSQGGLGPALRTLARRSRVAVELDAHIDLRLPERVEVAAYYVASEALTNAAKHANASVVRVKLSEENGTLRLSIRDDGIGGLDPGRGSGLVGLQDRVEALGGKITIDSTPGNGTSLVATLPLDEVG
jgi:signal transduction histidine kinase